PPPCRRAHSWGRAQPHAPRRFPPPTARRARGRPPSRAFAREPPILGGLEPFPPRRPSATAAGFFFVVILMPKIFRDISWTSVQEVILLDFVLRLGFLLLYPRLR